MSRNLKPRVAAAATEALARQGFVTPVDVCVGIGWLHASNVDDWRRGRVDDLADFLPVPGERITEFIVCLDSWATDRGLERTEAEYVSATRNRHPLRFFTGAPEAVEAVWRTRWVSRDLPGPKRDRIIKAQDSPPDLVVVQPIRDWTCAECQGTGGLLRCQSDESPNQSVQSMSHNARRDRQGGERAPALKTCDERDPFDEADDLRGDRRHRPAAARAGHCRRS